MRGDTPGASAHFTYGVLSLYGELGGSLHSGSLEKLLARLAGQLSTESESVAKGAARGLAAVACASGAGRLIGRDAFERAELCAHRHAYVRADLRP